MPTTETSPRFAMFDDSETPAARLRVVDDDLALSDSLRFLLESEGYSVDVFNSASDFLDDFDPDIPGCILLDLRIEHEDAGMEVLRALAKRRNHVPVIMISAYGQVRIAVDALHLGAIDFLEKPVEDLVLRNAVRIAVERSVRAWPLHREVDRILERLDTLTPRQTEVLHLVVGGRSSRQIAEQLGVVEKTVESHRREITKKMDAANASHLVGMTMLAASASDDPREYVD